MSETTTIFDGMRDHFPVDDASWYSYVSCFHRLDVPAKTRLLNEGDISKRMFLIEKGCIRAWFNCNGKDITCQFFFEGQSVGSIESFRKNIPGPANFETIEPSILWWIHKDDLSRIVEEITEFPALRSRFIDMIFERTFDYMKYFFSVLKDSPQERYLNLIRDRPQIVQRVAQHYIASYLGITPVHLSRIKNKIAKGSQSCRI